MSFVLFVDESGITGPNLNEIAQPVFVHVGLLVLSSHDASSRALAEQIRHDLLPKSDELHAGLLNTAKGRQRVGGLLRELASLEVLPLVSIMERRLVRAAYMVDTCFDHWWNEKAQPTVMSSAEARQALSQLIVDVVSDDIMVDFAAAFRRRDAETMVPVIAKVADAFRGAMRPDLADVVLEARGRLAEQCETIRTADHQATAMDTINVSSFAVIAAMCERAAAARGLVDGKILHDHCPQLGAYELMFSTMRGRTGGDIVFDNGQASVPLRRTAALASGDSKQEPLLQLADLVAGLYRRLTGGKDRIRNAAFDDWLLYAMFNANQTTNIMVSRQLVERVWGEPLRRFEQEARTRGLRPWLEGANWD